MIKIVPPFKNQLIGLAIMGAVVIARKARGAVRQHMAIGISINQIPDFVFGKRARQVEFRAFVKTITAKSAGLFVKNMVVSRGDVHKGNLLPYEFLQRIVHS
jgi:hypothetical protein